MSKQPNSGDVVKLFCSTFSVMLDKGSFGRQAVIAKRLLEKYSFDDISTTIKQLKTSGRNAYSLAYVELSIADILAPIKEELTKKRVAEMTMPEPEMKVSVTDNTSKATKFGSKQKWDGWG